MKVLSVVGNRPQQSITGEPIVPPWAPSFRTQSP